MRHTTQIGKHIAMPIAAPSPLVGEGITVGRSELGWVRVQARHLRCGGNPSPVFASRRHPLPQGEREEPHNSTSSSNMNTQLLIQLLVNGLVVGTLYGVVAMSFVLIYKATQVVNFAQGELLLIGAWVCWWLLTKYQVPFYLGMPITLIFMFLFGIAIQIVILRPMIGEPIISVIMVTIALSTVFSALMKWMFGVNLQPFPRVFNTQNVNILGLQVQTVYLMSLAVSLAMMAGMAWFFRSRNMASPCAQRGSASSGAIARHLGEERLRHGVGDLCNSFGGGRRGSGCRQRRFGGSVGLRHQGVSGGDPRWSRQCRRRGS